jgi:type I restriction enzyme M protein
MLDTQTKKKIDDCRDILVGKLPDPKSQIEQITIGLIYKFMDDMDKESIDLGGDAKFFSDDYAQYSWDSLMSPKVSANDLLKLYSEAIENMEKNPNIPQLFRDIFKNAYLPYRDPETLRMFLKEIGNFEYTHSEKLGDAFEYLLSIMGSQGDAGQFRTPRHIIDFLVKAVDPSKSDKILDPACGTAGFLVSAFKHIKDNNNNLTPDERQKLITNFIGYDISPDMVRMSLVNLYLHGFTSPHIFEYDSLTSENRWDDHFDVILANPPFMSPKGGIRPHSQFTVKSNRSEVLFVDYIAEHLNPKGRAGIIVPEGVIFQSGKAYKSLRKMLVENHLYAVVSLPAGVFNPYSGVKTSILLMDRQFAKKSNEILFVKIDNDGYNLGAQRNAVKGGQLEEAIDLLKQFKTGEFTESPIAHAVQKSEIAKNGDFNLSGERYKVIEASNSDYDLVSLSMVAVLQGGYAFKSSELKSEKGSDDLPVIKIGNLNRDGNLNLNNTQYFPFDNTLDRYLISKKDVLIAMTGATVGKTSVSEADNLLLNQRVGLVRSNSDGLSGAYLSKLLLSNLFYEFCQRTAGGGAQGNISPKEILSFEIPLPPLSVQEEIVSEIEGYQKIIDGAKMVVENYKPKIDIDPTWEMVELGDIITVLTDYHSNGSYKSLKENVTLKDKKDYAWLIRSTDFENDFKNDLKYIDEHAYNFLAKSKVFSGDFIINKIGNAGKIYLVPDIEMPCSLAMNSFLLRIDESKGLNKYVYHCLKQPISKKEINSYLRGATTKTIDKKSVRSLHIMLPPLKIQRQIVAKIEKEQELVNSSKQLIEIFEQKIKDRIAKVWGK